MKKAAVIIENRYPIEPIWARHEPFLKGWEMIHLQPPNMKSMRDYNNLLTSPSFWAQLLHFDRVLIFQHDSGLLKEGIEDFLKWEYIGAPWSFQDHGGNGGLSIRSPRVMHEICRAWGYDLAKHGNEDVWFCNIMKYNKHIYSPAPREECMKFSVESIYQLGTIGYHGIDTWLTEEQCQNIRTQYQ